MKRLLLCLLTLITLTACDRGDTYKTYGASPSPSATPTMQEKNL